MVQVYSAQSGLNGSRSSGGGRRVDLSEMKWAEGWMEDGADGGWTARMLVMQPPWSVHLTDRGPPSRTRRSPFSLAPAVIDRSGTDCSEKMFCSNGRASRLVRTLTPQLSLQDTPL